MFSDRLDLHWFDSLFDLLWTFCRFVVQQIHNKYPTEFEPQSACVLAVSKGIWADTLLQQNTPVLNYGIYVWLLIV